jgi:hypothetical protein
MAKRSAVVREMTLHEEDAQMVAAVARKRVGLCIIEVDAGLEETVGNLYIREALPSAATQRLDGRIVAAASGGWRVEEIDELLLGPSNRTPMICNVIVVRDGGAMSAAGRDRLLKTLEEPAARSSFCLLVRSIDELGATILGRAGEVLRLHESDGEIVGWLLEKGARAEVLGAFGADWDSSLGLLYQLGDGNVIDTFLAGAGAWASTTPFATSAELTRILEGLGSDPLARRGARSLARALLGALRANVARNLARGTIGALDAQMVLASVEGALENVTYTTPLSLVVARALARAG